MSICSRLQETIEMISLRVQCNWRRWATFVGHKQTSARRISKTVAAQMYNQILVVAQQLLLAPLLVRAWGIETYGVWLLLSAIPNYLSVSDFGFTMVAKNEMTIRLARKEQETAVEIYQSVFVMLLGISLVVFVAALASLPFVSLGTAFQIGSIDQSEATGTLWMLAGNVLIQQFMLLICAGFRGVGRPDSEVGWSATSRLGELFATACGALISNQVIVAAILVLVSRVTFTAIMYVMLVRRAPFLRLGVAKARFAEIKRLFHPSLSYTMWTAAGVLLLQGPIVVLATGMSPAVIATYSTSRTLTRLGISGINIFNFSVTPEYSRLFGERRFGEIRILLSYHLLLAAASIIGYAVFMALFGPTLMDWWMGGRIKAVEPLFAILVATVAAEMAWSVGFVAFSSINRHVGISYCYVALAVAVTATIYFFVHSLGVVGVAISVLLGQIAMLGITVAFGVRLRRYDK
jgi:O-antigen/teichoic acid export membrane protein